MIKSKHLIRQTGYKMYVCWTKHATLLSNCGNIVLINWNSLSRVFGHYHLSELTEVCPMYSSFSWKILNSISPKLNLVEVSNFRTSGFCRWSKNIQSCKTIKTKETFPVSCAQSWQQQWTSVYLRCNTTLPSCEFGVNYMMFCEQTDMVRRLGKRLRYWKWKFADQYGHKGEFDSRHLGAKTCFIFWRT
jgi:hypothetical protein